MKDLPDIDKVVPSDAGFFSFNSLSDKENYIIFVRFVKEDVEYMAAVKVKESDLSDEKEQITLNVYPKRMNGFSVLFTDIFDGPIPNLPIRVYKSRFAALYDSVKYASWDTITNAQSIFSWYNIEPRKYYFVARDTMAGVPYALFDSTTVPVGGIKKDTAMLKP